MKTKAVKKKAVRQKRKSSAPRSPASAVGFIGFGRMGSALAEGALEAGVLAKSRVFAFDPEPDASHRMRRFGIKKVSSIRDLMQKAQLIFLCVKPQKMSEVLREIASAEFRHRCFVSIAAGIPIRRIQEGLNAPVPVIRVMPNTPALLGAGMSAASAGRGVRPSDLRRVKTILASVGRVIEVHESLMDAVTAVSGSGPAYVFYLAEGMISAGVELGLDPADARILVAQTVLGAGRMLSDRTESPEELRRQVTSPGGTTEAAIGILDDRGVRQGVQDALRRARDRSVELSGAPRERTGTI